MSATIMTLKDNLFHSQLSHENWISKYRFANETPIETFKRVAKALASVEKPEIQAYWEDQFFNCLVNIKNDTVVGLKCTPGGRITANAGTQDETKGKHATLFNCFIAGPVTNADFTYYKTINGKKIKFSLKTDDTPDDLSNIFLTLLEQAKTLASEGGYGINFDFIRPRGAVIKGTRIKHPGVIAYMNVWDEVAAMIIKGDNDGYVDTLKNYLTEEELGNFQKEVANIKTMPRKGAQMACLTVNHPDIEEFIRAKQTPGVLTKFNISVLVTDEFMEAVEKDTLFSLTFNKKIYKRVKARELYNLIMKSTYNRAEPGILYYDAMQENNPISYLGLINATNPCFTGEMRLHTDQGMITMKELYERGTTNNVVVDNRVEKGGFINPQKSNGISFKPATAVTMTGKDQEILRLEMESGNHLRVTPYHHFPTSTGWIEAKDLKVGDEILLQSGEGGWGKFGNLEYGVLLGLLTGDGTFCQNVEKRPTFKKQYITNSARISLWEENQETKDLVLGYLEKVVGKKHNTKDNKQKTINGKIVWKVGSALFYKLIEQDIKDNPRKIKDRVPEIIWQGSQEMVTGYLQGFFYADGSVNWGKKNKTLSIRLAQSNLQILQDIQILLNNFGICSKLRRSRPENDTMLPDGKGGMKLYHCKANYELMINRANSILFKEKIGFFGQEKNQKLDNCLSLFKKEPQLNQFKTFIKSIEKDGIEDVYCLTQQTTNSVVVNGTGEGQCGEIGGQPTLTTTCLLGNINLTQYITPDRKFNFVQYIEDIKIFTRILDNVNDLSYLPLPRYENAVKTVRQFGMGLNGLGSALYMLGLRYGSIEAKEFTSKLCQIKENITFQTSALLAKEKGAFPYYDAEKFQNTPYFKSDRLSEETKEMIRKYGVRNAKTTTNPPNGNTSVICNNVSNGMEPVFLHEYQRTRVIDQWPTGLTLDNVKTILKEVKAGDVVVWEGNYAGKHFYYEPHNRGLCIIEPVYDYGYLWIKENCPEDLQKDYLVTTNNLTVEEHLDMQAVVQRHCNQSVSKTINIPNNYSFEDFKEVYMKGWKLKLCGLTTYRHGTMESVISEKGEEKQDTKILESVKLPDTFLNGPTHVIKKEGMKFYIHFSYHPEDIKHEKPIAMWINSNHKMKGESIPTKKMIQLVCDLSIEKGLNNTLVNSYQEKIKDDELYIKLSKTVSLALRHNVTPYDIVEKTKDLPEQYVTTLVYAVRKFLSEHIKNGSKVKDSKCPMCSSSNVVYESGCTKCLDCGASNCA